MDKKKATRILHKIYLVLKEPQVKVILNRKIDPVYGFFSMDNKGRWVIEINPIKKGAKGGLIRTMLHECLHLIDCEMPEEEVIELENNVFKYLTDRQLTNLFRRIAYAM